jgi:hypothetical protein
LTYSVHVTIYKILLCIQAEAEDIALLIMIATHANCNRTKFKGIIFSHLNFFEHLLHEPINCYDMVMANRKVKFMDSLMKT